MRRHLSLIVFLGLLLLALLLAFGVFNGYHEGYDKGHDENCEILARSHVYTDSCR